MSHFEISPPLFIPYLIHFPQAIAILETGIFSKEKGCLMPWIVSS